MTDKRRDLRAFPRLSWAHPAQLEVHDILQDAQVADLSLGGCKLMPSHLDPLVAADLRPGASLKVIIDGIHFDAVMRWATPNHSAIGCAFESPLSAEALTRLGVKVPEAAE